MKNSSGKELKQKKWMVIEQGLSEDFYMGNWQFRFFGERVEFSTSKPDGTDGEDKYKCFRIVGARCLTKKAFREKFPEMPLKELKAAWGAILGKRRDDIINRLMKQFNIIATTPKHYVTLTVDRTQRPYKSIKKENRIFNEFTRTLMRKYPYAWFVYKKEYECVPHIHYHLIGTLYSRQRALCSLRRTQSLVKALWDETNGFIWGKSTKVKPFVKGCHDGYVTKPEKRNEDMRCVELLRGSHMVGVIGQKNVEFYEEYPVELTDAEKVLFFSALEDYFREEGRLEWFYKQLRRSAGNFAFVPQEVQKEAFEKATGLPWETLNQLA